MACALRGEPGEIYNLASGEEVAIRDLAELINALSGNKTPISLTPARDWDRSGQRFGDPSKARERLGFAATVALEEGLGRTIAWTRENHARILRCMTQHARYVSEVRAYGA
jgi:UDP-glucose 4-epimerase